MCWPLLSPLTLSPTGPLPRCALVKSVTDCGHTHLHFHDLWHLLWFSILEYSTPAVWSRWCHSIIFASGRPSQPFTPHKSQSPMIPGPCSATLLRIPRTFMVISDVIVFMLSCHYLYTYLPWPFPVLWLLLSLPNLLACWVQHFHNIIF